MFPGSGPVVSCGLMTSRVAAGRLGESLLRQKVGWGAAGSVFIQEAGGRARAKPPLPGPQPSLSGMPSETPASGGMQTLPTCL